ncbi:Ureohydrolase [Mycena floridula]|nr:Ureohydrolase [Mycena floridula]
MLSLLLYASLAYATEWTEKYGAQKDMSFTGPLSFGHLPYARCLEEPSVTFDIAILGMPFDTATSYRPGARFGPRSIRTSGGMGYTLSWGRGALDNDAALVDCGDIPIIQMDNTKAVDQMEVAYSSLLANEVRGGTGPRYKPGFTSSLALDKKEHPRIVTLGGDHTITLPILRSLAKVYGSISVIHFDSHLDTSNVTGHIGQERLTHGSYFAVAYEEGLLSNTSIHAGIRQKLRDGLDQINQDEFVQFQIITTEDLDDYGIKNVIKKIRQRVGTGGPVYLTLDIDVVDPGLAPATGTPEVGGWTVREVKRILRGLAGLNFVGMDIVEVAPAYDGVDESTSRAASSIVEDFLNMMQMKEVPLPHGEREEHS